jgi:hypothetical protein
VVGVGDRPYPFRRFRNALTVHLPITDHRLPSQ